MSIVIFLISLLFCAFSYYQTRKIYHPAIVFNLWWGTTVLISGGGFYGVEIPSNLTYIYILVAIISYNVPFLVTNRNAVNIDKHGKSLHTLFANETAIPKMFILLEIGVLIVLIYRSALAIEILANGNGYDAVRYYYYKSDLIQTFKYSQLFSFLVITPTVILGIVMSSINIFQKKKNYPLIVLSVANVILLAFSSGGRQIVVYLLISVALSFIIYFFEKGLDKQLLKKVSVFLTIIVVIIVFMSFQRGGQAFNINDFIETVTVYVSGSYIYLEKILPVVRNSDIYTYGLSFFGAIIDIFILALNFIGAEITQISSHMAEFNQTWIDIGGGIQFNAFTTMLYAFFYDFRELGFVVGPLIFGLISGLTFNNYINKRTYASLGMFIMILIAIYESTTKWMGIHFSFWIPFILFMLMDIYDKRVNIYKKQEENIINSDEL